MLRDKTLGDQKLTAFEKGRNGTGLLRALDARGIPHRYLSANEITVPRHKGKTVLAFSINGREHYFDATSFYVEDPEGVKVPGPIIDGASSGLLKWKQMANALLRQAGVNVPEGVTATNSARRDAETLFLALVERWQNGVCLKPANGSKGKHVTVGLREPSEFRRAFEAAASVYELLLLEETVTGTVYRFLCLAGRVLAARYGRPANVTGDGEHTIAELIERKNLERQRCPMHGYVRLQLRPKERRFLQQQAIEPDDVPPPRQRVFLDSTSNLAQGAEMIDATDNMHPSYIAVAERASAAIPGLVLCGMDMAIDDIEQPATPDNHHVLEMNCGPGLSAHHTPWEGKPRDVSGAIVDYLCVLKNT